MVFLSLVYLDKFVWIKYSISYLVVFRIMCSDRSDGGKFGGVSGGFEMKKKQKKRESEENKKEEG